MQSLDRLDIDTPEQIALELPLAGIGSRFLALAFDSLIQFIVAVAIFIVAALTSWTGLLSNVFPEYLAPILSEHKVRNTIGQFASFQVGQMPSETLAEIICREFRHCLRGDFSSSGKIFFPQHSLDPNINRESCDSLVGEEHHAIRYLCSDAR